MGKLEDTQETLKGAAAKHRSALVAFSAGKDSLTVLDLCTKYFETVEAFYFYLIPELSFMEKRLEDAAKHWNVRIRQYPDYHLFNFLKEGVYTYEWYKWKELPDLTQDDMYAHIIKDTGIPLVVTGAKKSDFLYRRLNLGRHHRNVTVIHPISSWQRFDVLAYMKACNIPIPVGTAALTNAVDLTPKNVLWLYDNFPDDYKKLREYFPFAEAIVWRRKFFGNKFSENTQRKSQQEQEALQTLKPKGWKN